MRLINFPVLIFSCLLLLLTSQLQPVAAAGNFSLSLEGDRLSLRAENILLQTILRKLAEKHITVRIDPAINPAITANFNKRPIEQALESLLKPASFSLLWEGTAANSGEKSLRLAEIQVFQSGQKNRMKPLKPPRAELITKNKEGVFYVKDEILLYLPAGTDLVKLRQLLQSYNATLVENIDLPGVARVLLPENADVFAIASEIKSQLGLVISQPNYAYPIQSPVPLNFPTALAHKDPDLYGPSANSVPIAILDSGLSDNADLNKFILSSLDVMNPGFPISDTLGHGTQMAFIASGVVKPYGSEIDNDSYIPVIPIRAFDDNGYTTDFKIMESINFALENHARVMSLSWGSETKSELLERTFAYANSKGLIIVASAGNEPTGKPVYPAAYSSVIGVGALDPHGKTWAKSNYGNFVALYAPGFADLPVGYKGDPGLYAGTSISAALVANTIADYISQNPDATLQEIHEFLNKKF